MPTLWRFGRGRVTIKRLYWAMSAYALLAAMAALTLDGKFRLAVWIFLGGLALKTLIAYKAHTL
jgi:hypothetical protein